MSQWQYDNTVSQRLDDVGQPIVQQITAEQESIWRVFLLPGKVPLTLMAARFSTAQNTRVTGGRVSFCGPPSIARRAPGALKYPGVVVTKV